MGWTVGFSLLINLMTLTSSLYMMQVYDRVLTSGSLDTLLYLSLIAVGALTLMTALDYLRSLTLIRLGGWLERRLGAATLTRVVDGTLAGRPERTDMLRDLSILRGVLGSGSAFLFDAPWIPVYVGVIYVLHPMLGHLAVGAAVVLFGLVMANDRVARRGVSAATIMGRRALTIAESAVRNAEVMDALNQLPGVVRRWQDHNRHSLDLQEKSQQRGAVLLHLTKLVRQVVHVAILGLGAWLVLRQELSGGAMIASSIVLGRALAPIEQAIGGWRQVSAGREALRRLNTLFERPLRRPAGLPLPVPAGHLTVQNLVFFPTGNRRPILQGVSFEVRPGEAVAIIGPSAAGKSTLARLVVGLYPPTSGAVRLDGADLFRWRRDDVGRHIGYLPQDVALFSGTVAENIARMGDPDPVAVVEAARVAECHDMILRLPDGYDTDIGEGGACLSGGQRQRLALARALYGAPGLVVLDEPNANLDAQGEEALSRAIAGLKERGSAVVVVGHRPGTLAQVDRILVLRDGRVEAFGPRADVLENMKRRTLHTVTPGTAPAATVPIRHADKGMG
jgi:PrtD family type I secretion system ABC transporter